MKTINLYLILVIIFTVFISTSCEEYLDKTIESDLTKEEVFKDFEHAQGYVEQMYTYVVNHAVATGRVYSCSNFLLGDETIGNSTNFLDMFWERGSLERWEGTGFFRKGNVTAKVTDADIIDRFGIWDGWEAIRMANTALQNIDLMVGATETEKNLIKGQALFFRAFFHLEMMQYWGRIPYVDKVLTGNEGDYKLLRTATYQECALRADEDFAAAADLVPLHWDSLQSDPNATFLTYRHAETFGKNMIRINKTIVYSFKGKNLLLAASPLMQGNSGTYMYNEELCKRAAEDFARVIKIDRDDNKTLGLATKDNYPQVFYTSVANKFKWVATPGNMGGSQGEFIFSSTSQPIPRSQFIAKTFMPYSDLPRRVVPCHSFIHKVFGTANGLACDEDPTHNSQKEFDNRDPRFYKWLIIDGDLIISNASANKQYKYARLYTDGLLRQKVPITPTGYFIKKWADITYNFATQTGGASDGQTNNNAHWLNMRLTDVYLMYAEALAATTEFGVDKAPTYPHLSGLSSLDVINMIRDRFNIPHVEISYPGIQSNRTKFMDVVRRERATELCFEGHRWTDLRRWMLAHLDTYKVKTGIDFDRDNPLSTGDRTTFKNTNFKERVILTRVCEYPKHFWLPFPINQTQMYSGFEQNPGW